MRAVERGLVPEDLVELADREGRPEWRAAAAVLQEYDQVTAFSRPGAYDPAWVLSATADLIEESPERLARARERFGLIVVDDAQELTWSAARLLSVVRAPDTQLVLIGDPDLAVQTFRGADPRLFAHEWERWFGGDDLLTLGEAFVLAGSHRQPPRLAALTARVAGQVGSVGVVAHRRVVASATGSEPDDRAAARADEGAVCAPVDPGPAPPGADPATGHGTVETAVLPTVAQEAAYIAGRLRRAHLLDGVPWSQMAVLVRGRSGSAALRRALAGAGVPVASSMTDLPVRDEPAARALLALLEVVVRVARGDERPIEPDLATELLQSPLGASDPVTVRRLRRSLRQADRAAGGSTRGDLLVAQALLAPELLSEVPAAESAGARRICRALAAAVDAARLDERGRWQPGVTAELLLWQLWSALGLAEGWRSAALAGGLAAARFDRHLDAVVALFGAATSFAERLPGAGPEAFLDQTLGQEVAADSLVPQAPLEEVVRVLTPQSAAGLSWDLVVVAQLQEGSGRTSGCVDPSSAPSISSTSWPVAGTAPARRWPRSAPTRPACSPSRSAGLAGPWSPPP